ncbi:MAG TPA: cytochrome c [Rhodobacterales bacterium]|nr:cytochrome c [Rhodobacterales bacterium]
MNTRKTILAATLLLGAATAAFAAAQDPDVRARQEVMGLIGSNLKKIAPMAQGKADFDAAVAQAAFAKIAEKAAMVPGVFETRSNTDPEAEAKDALWDNWDDFVSKAAALQNAAEAGANVDSLEALQAAFGPLAGTCKSCHTAYKE